MTTSELQSSLTNQQNTRLKVVHENFAQNVEEAILYRNKIIRETLELVTQQLSKDDRDTYKMFEATKFIKQLVESPVTMAIVGRVNSGKSMLASELIDRQIVLPNSQEATTGKITRLVHSDTLTLKLIKIEGRSSVYKESPEPTIDLSNNDKTKILDQLISLNEKNWENEELNDSIVEIGLPCDLLKSGFRIIDCPGQDRDLKVENKQLKLLKEMMPSVVCYVYDHKPKFKIADGETLDRVHNELRQFNSLLRDDGHSVQYIIVANKVDSGEGNENDISMTDTQIFEPNEATQSVRENCKFALSNSVDGLEMYEKFDLERVMTIRPLSAAMRYLTRLNPNEEIDECYINMIENLMHEITRKIKDQALDIINMMAYFVGRSDMEEYRRESGWYKLKSMSLEEDLIQLITKGCSNNRNLVLNFTRGYKLFALWHRNMPILVTRIQKQSQEDYEKEKKRIYDERRPRIHSLKVKIYDCKGDLTLYLFNKQMPHQRLLDSLENFNIDQIQSMINQVATINQVLGDLEFCDQFRFKQNFRADNLFVDDNNVIHINRNIPNDPELPFLLKDDQAVPPFHLHSHVITIYPYYKSEYKYLAAMVEFITSFGWFVFILIEGRGSINSDLGSKDVATRIESLKSGLFPDYPEYLREVMRLCWSVEWIEDRRQFNLNLQNHWQRIVDLIMNDFWMKNHSSILEESFIQMLIENCTADNILMNFNHNYRIFAFTTDEEEDIQVTRISTGSQHDTERMRIYQQRCRKSNTFPSIIYEYPSQSDIYLFNRGLPRERLIDHLQEFEHFGVIETFIKQAAELNKDLNSLKPNFRADNVYYRSDVESGGSTIFINHDIPNTPELPFLMKDKIPVSPPIHLHPNIESIDPCHANEFKNLSAMVEFITSFGWFVFILIDGRGSIDSDLASKDVATRIESLKSGLFPDYPEYLDDVLRLCWTMETSNDAGYTAMFYWQAIKLKLKIKP